MIKSLKVVRKYRNESTSVLPYGIPDISSLGVLKINEFNKLLILLEQGILLKYLTDMSNSNELTSYRTTLQDLFLSTIPSKCSDENIAYKYLDFYTATKKLLFQNVITPSVKNFYYDKDNFSHESFILPKNFALNYLKSCSLDINENLGINPILLIPHMKGDSVVFKKKEFVDAKFNLAVPTSIKLNDTLNYITTLNWTGLPLGTLLDTIQTFSLYNNSKLSRSENISSYINGIFEQNISSLIDTSSMKSTLLKIINYYYVEKSIKLHRNNFGFLLTQMGYDEPTTTYYTQKDPLMSSVESFKSYSELSSFKRTFAEGDEFEEDEEIDNSGDDFDDGGNDDFGDDDFSGGDDDFGDDDFGDDSGDDFGSDDSSEEEIREDTVETPEDPLTILMKVVNSETVDEYVERNLLIDHIINLINDPPITLTTNKIELLKTWVSQWINVVSVDTTKQILSRLGL